MFRSLKICAKPPKTRRNYMFRKNALALILVTSFVLVGSAGPSLARKWTVTQRQEALLKEIESDYKANQLTLAERDDLKEQRQKIVDREKSMKDKNGGKLSYEDNRKLEKDLNNLSIKLQKKVLAKRVAK
jgi:hypothetical protein